MCRAVLCRLNRVRSRLCCIRIIASGSCNAGLGDPERLCAQQTGRMHAGRGAMPVIELDSSSERIVVRKYRRGGLLRFLNADVFLGPQRPFNELAVTLRAAQAGIPVADIVGALSLRVYGPLYRHYLVSRELTDCCDLPTWFQERTGADEDSAALCAQCCRLYQAHA